MREKIIHWYKAFRILFKSMIYCNILASYLNILIFKKCFVYITILHIEICKKKCIPVVPFLFLLDMWMLKMTIYYILHIYLKNQTKIILLASESPWDFHKDFWVLLTYYEFFSSHSNESMVWLLRSILNLVKSFTMYVTFNDKCSARY